MFPQKLFQRLKKRKEQNTHRTLSVSANSIDFSSNDYLGFAHLDTIFNKASDLVKNKPLNGATGSRLLSGNNSLYLNAEEQIAKYHKVEAALLFNSGYDANIGFFSSVPQRGDFIFYDESIHASIRDGISLSKANSYKFKHNRLDNLKTTIDRIINYDNSKNYEVYVVTESVFSMDGDSPELIAFTDYCQKIGAHLIVDEAHALGVFNFGLVQKLNLEKKVFARLVTFGKGLGCHGAAFLGSKELKDYLINFARSFIYTTALPPHSIATIITSYQMLIDSEKCQELNENINFFKEEIEQKNIKSYFIKSESAIHSCVFSNTKKVKDLALHLNDNKLDVRPILSPTVKKGEERLRIILHSYNTKEEIKKLVSLLSDYLK